MTNALIAAGAVFLIAVIFALIAWPWDGPDHAKVAAVYGIVFILSPVTFCASGLAFLLTLVFFGGGGNQ